MAVFSQGGGVRFPAQSICGAAQTLPANANETVILTTPPLTLPFDNARVLLMWFVMMTIGAGTTFITWTIRRGTTIFGLSPSFGPWNQTVVAGNQISHGGSYSDTPGAVTGQQYVLTVTQTGATAPGGITDSHLAAFVL